MQLRYNYRIDPTPGQIKALARAFGCARVVFNDGAAARRSAYAVGAPYPTSGQLSKALTAAKKTPERAWLAEVSAVVLQGALADLEAAYQNFFDSRSGKRKGPRMGRPAFKSRRDNRQAIRFTANARFKVTAGGALRLPKVGDVKVRWSRDLPSTPSSVTVVKDASGRYFASFVVDTDPAADTARFPLVDQYTETGIDLGLTHFVVRSDGTKVTAPKLLRNAERRLKKLQRSLSRKQKGSNNRKKAAVNVARAHARVVDARADFHHKLSTRIIVENQAVYVEDLAVKALARTRMAKSVHDAGWSAFVNMLQYKAARYGRYFAKIDRFAPTSQVCSACGRRDGPKALNIREWTCPACGADHDRDVNAANNILAAGRAERLNGSWSAGKTGKIPAQRGEAATRPGDPVSAKPAPPGAEGILAL